MDPGMLCSLVINPLMFYRESYCARSEMENRSKEQQLFLFADRTSCSRFIANQYRLMQSSFAYVLLHGIRRLTFQCTITLKAGSETGNFQATFSGVNQLDGSFLPISTTSNPFSYTVSAVPEPSSMALLGCVALGGYVIRRRRRNVNA
jgi:hypothetical protein